MSDPLSPVSLAAVPEVRKALEAVKEEVHPTVEDRLREAVFDDSVTSAETVQLVIDITADAVASPHNSLLLAVRDATLKAERDRLLAQTPEATIEAAAKAGLVNGLYAKTNLVEANDRFKGELRIFLEAALPVLLAPEVAKREQVERERDEAREALDANWVTHQRVVAAEAEVARLKGEIAAATLEIDVGKHFDAYRRLCAALGGAK